MVAALDAHDNTATRQHGARAIHRSINTPDVFRTRGARPTLQNVVGYSPD